MSDYESESEASEIASETSEQEDYPEDNSQNDLEELEDRYNEYITEKYRLILAFNDGTIDPQSYLINLARINRDLNESQYNARELEQKIIEKETQLRYLLDNLESKISERESSEIAHSSKEGSLKRNILTESEITELKTLRYQLEDLMDSHKIIEEDNEPLQSNGLYNEWNALSIQEKIKLEKLTGMNYPVPGTKNFEKAQDEFINNVSIFLKSYWEPYEKKEEKELLALADKLKISPPKKTSYSYTIFLNYMRTLLPYGFVYKTGIRKAGGVYEKVEMKPIKEKLDELKQLRKELPIQLTPEEKEFSDKLKLYNDLLHKLDESHLRSCMVSAENLKSNIVSMKREEPFKVLKGGKLIPAEEYIAGRGSSKQKLIKSLNGLKAPELHKLILPDGNVVNNVNYKVGLLEEYIFKLTKDSPKSYYSKIKDILFILEHYPDFKLKFLNGEINIYQLALFENILRQNDITHIYPVNTPIRKDTIRKLLEELYVNTYNIQRFRKSEILTKVILTKKSKELERFVFDLAENKRDYILKIKKVTGYIKKHPTGILVLPFDQLTKVFNEEPISIDSPPDYSKMSYAEIHALLLQEQYSLQDLEKKKRRLEAKNYTSSYVLFWQLPEIIPEEKRKQWKVVLDKINQKMNLPKPLSENDKKLIQVYIDDLNRQRYYMVKQYKLDFVSSDINKEITAVKEKIHVLEQIRLKFDIEELNRLRQSRKQEQLPQFEVSTDYKVINEETIFSLVNAVKRKMLEIDIQLLELYDMNELNNKTMVTYNGKKIRSISMEVYTKIKEYLLNKLHKIKPNFEILDKMAVDKAIKEISGLIGISIEITTTTNAIKQLTSKWVSSWNGQIKTDYYGENVFEKLLGVTGPFDFYKVYREYSELVKQFTPPKQETYTKPRALFNGTWYNVEYLDKDWATGQPLKSYKEELEKNPKTGMYEVVHKVTVRKGRFPFIKVILRTEQVDKTKEMWQEILPGQVRYQTISFGRKKNK